MPSRSLVYSRRPQQETFDSNGLHPYCSGKDLRDCTYTIRFDCLCLQSQHHSLFSVGSDLKIMAGILSRTKRKVVITRDMGPNANALLECSKLWPSLEVYRWEEDRPAPRDWFLQSVSGATALLITLCDKARPSLNWGGFEV